jgi:hypothetical protein
MAALAQSISSSLSITDICLTTSLKLIETITLSETTISTYEWQKSLSDTITISDNCSTVTLLLLSEIALSEDGTIHSHGWGCPISETITISDELQAGMYLNETITVSDEQIYVNGEILEQDITSTITISEETTNQPWIDFIVNVDEYIYLSDNRIPTTAHILLPAWPYQSAEKRSLDFHYHPRHLGE